MVALLAPTPEGADPLPPQIALLRIAMLDCRAAPRRSLGACRVLDPTAGAEIHASALAQLLVSAGDRRFVIWRPGTPGLSFDENWLAALIAAYARDDQDSARFLLARRIRPQACAAFGLLLASLTLSLE